MPNKPNLIPTTFIDNRQIRSYSEGGKRTPIVPNKPKTVANIPKYSNTFVNPGFKTQTNK